MKSVNFTSSLVLLLLVGCATQHKVPQSALQFNWGTSHQLEVVERVNKKSNSVELIHHGYFLKTNEIFVLQWRNPTITEINGEKVSGSKELEEAVAQLGLEKTMIYPSFRISKSGEFIEAINVEESLAKVNRLIDKVATNRPEDSRKFLDDMAKSESGKAYLNQIYGAIWQTWVAAWTDVNLADGESQSIDGLVDFSGVEVPATGKTTNLGPTTGDMSIVSLKYEQNLSGTNLLSGLNSFIEKMATETKIKSAGPITNECSVQLLTILEVQTERKTLKPHWAKRTTTTTYSAPGEQKEMESEIREYNFQWDRTNISKFTKQP